MRKQKLYTCSAIEGFINEYKKNGGKVIELEEGALGYGLTVCFGGGFKTSVIKEVPLNEWQCAHSVRMYNEMPKKYEKMIEEYYIKQGVEQETLSQILGRKLIKP